MKKKFIFIALLAQLGLAVAGCPSPTGPGEGKSGWLQESYFPNEEGHFWTYKGKYTEGMPIGAGGTVDEFTTTIEILNDTETIGGKVYQARWTESSWSTSCCSSHAGSRSTFRVDSEGFFVQERDGEYREIEFGVKSWSEEASFTFTVLNTTFTETIKITGEIQGDSKEKVSVPLGSFDAYKVKIDFSSEFKDSSGNVTFTSSSTSFNYMVDDVGMIKKESVDENGKITSTEELESKNF